MSDPPRTACVLLLLFGFGCQPEVTCPESEPPCGGDPSGGSPSGTTWNVIGACRDPAFARPLPGTYFQQPVQIARQPTPAMASSDWCSSLTLGNIMGSTGVTGFSFPHDTLAVVPGGQITYTSDDAQQQKGTFEAAIRTAGTGGIDLSAACLTRTGTSLSCDMVATALTEFVAMGAMKSVNPGILCTDGPDQPATCQFFFSYQNISCVPISPGSPDNACHCTYDVSFAGSLHGRWLRSGALLTHSDASRTLPSHADYCVDGSGGSLTLWGHDRTSILDQTGIRTLQLSRAP